MVGKFEKVIVLASMLSGLCAPVSANTTMTGVAGSNPAPTTPGTTAAIAPIIAQAPAPAQIAAPISAPISAQIPVPSISSPAAIRVALLLPLRSDALRAAAEAVQAGFMAAYEHESSNVALTVMATGDSAQEVLATYSAAIAQHDMVVGPLSRADVLAVAQGAKVSKPTIVLTQPELTGEVEVAIPQNMLAIGLSVEDEGRQVANWAKGKSTKALVVSTPIAWQRRAAKAFVAEWKMLGLEQQSLELGVFGAYLSASSLAQLKQQIANDKPTVLFAALDAAQTRQLREAAGKDVTIYGTSQMNPYAYLDWAGAESIPELNGVRFVDIPWQLLPDHPAVMVYPRIVASAEQKRNVDLERLYALGIDAFRIAREIAGKRRKFDIDGVTGKLAVSFGNGAPRFERVEQAAIYQDGIVVPLLRGQ